MTFVDLIKGGNAKAFRYGPIRGRVRVEDNSFVFSHPEPFGYGPDNLKVNDNWFGVSVYSPDWLVLIGDTSVRMSLNGMTCPYNEKYDALFQNCSAKYIRIQRGHEVIWETWSGEIPDESVLSKCGLDPI